MESWAEHSGRNRAAWNEIAETRTRQLDARGLDAGFFARGGINLEPPVQGAVGDVRGQNLLRLQCASGGADATETKVQFAWPLGDVITALVDAGLVIRRLTEYPGIPSWCFAPPASTADYLPGRYLLLAAKPV